LLIRSAEKHYHELKNILGEFYKCLPIKTLRNIYGFMINFCLKEADKGELHYRMELDEIYRRSIPFGVWDTGIAFPPHYYMTHVKNMLYLSRYEAVLEFQNEYQAKLRTKYIPDIPNLSHAYYYFHIGDYDKAQEYLNQMIDREDFAYILYCKRLLIQIYYEKKELMAIENAVEALRFYLLPNRNKDIGKRSRIRNKNFLNTCKKILRQRNNAEHDQASLNILKKIKKEVKETEHLADREWLFEKTEEIIAEQIAAS